MTKTQELTGIKRLYALVEKVQRRGIEWLCQRIKREFLLPTTGPTRVLGKVRVSFERWGRRIIRRAPPSNGDILFFFLDLEVCPITYDAVTYLAIAELRRRELNLSAIHVVVVPGTVEGLRAETPDYETAIDAEARRWRLHNLVVPLFRLLPSCTGYTIFGSRDEALRGPYARAEHVFPVGYSVNVAKAPIPREICDAARAGRFALPMFRATPKGLAYMRQFLEPRAQGRRIVVINLRHSAFMPVRNSTDENWFTFARELDQTRWLPVFVLDTDVALAPVPRELDEFVVCHAAAWNNELRMALYELADLTMSIGQGPMELCWFNDRCRYAFFLRPNASPQSSDEAHRAHGFEIGKNPPYAVAGQRWVWASDDLPIIRSVFTEMTAE
jgi:hypothetical protein